MDWSELIDETAIRVLLSDAITHFARPIREALVIFLSGLPAAGQRELLSTQAALPSAATTTQRLGALVQQCPVLHKLGQALARDRRLDPVLRRELSKLEALSPRVPVVALRRALRHELGDLDRLGIVLEPTAIAEASVAVVIGYRDRDANGVFKILKPGIDKRLDLELALLAEVGREPGASPQRGDRACLGRCADARRAAGRRDARPAL